jgi:hypothetical protein
MKPLPFVVVIASADAEAFSFLIMAFSKAHAIVSALELFPGIVINCSLQQDW